MIRVPFFRIACVPREFLERKAVSRLSTRQVVLDWCEIQNPRTNDPQSKSLSNQI